MSVVKDFYQANFRLKFFGRYNSGLLKSLHLAYCETIAIWYGQTIFSVWIKKKD